MIKSSKSIIESSLDVYYEEEEEGSLDENQGVKGQDLGNENKKATGKGIKISHNEATMDNLELIFGTRNIIKMMIPVDWGLINPFKLIVE